LTGPNQASPNSVMPSPLASFAIRRTHAVDPPSSTAYLFHAWLLPLLHLIIDHHASCTVAHSLQLRPQGLWLVVNAGYVG
jgi:hypothetical protein